MPSTWRVPWTTRRASSSRRVRWCSSALRAATVGQIRTSPRSSGTSDASIGGRSGPLVPASGYDPKAPAMEFDYTDGRGNVGIIASVSRPFCASCNRLRLTAEGKLRNCLFALDEVDVKPYLRGQPDDDALAGVIRRNVRAKWEGHEINTARFVKPLRTMHAIGG